MFMHRRLGRLTSWLLGGALAAGTVLASFAPLAAVPVYAAPAVEEPPPADGAGLRGAAVKLAYQRLHTVETRQQGTIDKALAGADRIAELIDQARERGRDVSALESALASFRSAMDSAQTKHNRGVAILTAHAGFDLQGEVTDLKAAWETVRSAGAEFRDAGKTIASALRELHTAIRDWREANREAMPEKIDWPSEGG
jgi:post-segregation antitoxin (ccd killing protein)